MPSPDELLSLSLWIIIFIIIRIIFQLFEIRLIDTHSHFSSLKAYSISQSHALSTQKKAVAVDGLPSPLRH